ncbi:MAG: GGDEF domain-containing protein [Magnetococcus sp. MYC-9]
MSETRRGLEQIRDLLSSDPPNHREAVRLTKNLLMHGPCGREQEPLRQVSLLLLERLVRPALAGAQEKQARVGRMIRQIRTAQSLDPQTLEADLREIGAWVTALGRSVQVAEAEPDFPASLVQKALVVLGGKATQELLPTDKPPHWPEIHLRLGAIINQERRWREHWQREQESLHTLLTTTSQTMVDTLRLIGADAEDLPQVLEQARQGHTTFEWQELQEALLRAVQRFRERAVEIRHRLRTAQEAVERSRALIRQADWALMETRDERLLDTFTGLPNRFGLLARLEQAKQLDKKEGFALVAILLEEYGQIVRALGRERVQNLVGAIVGRMLSLLRPGDYLARFNDETFVLIGFQMTAEHAVDMALLWHEVLDRTCFEISNAKLMVRSHYGVACYEPGDNSERLLNLAVAAAQEAQQEGASRVRVVPGRPKPTPPPAKKLFRFRP